MVDCCTVQSFPAHRFARNQAFPLQFGQYDGQGTGPKRHHGGDVELPPFAPGCHSALWVSIDQRGFSAVKQSLHRQRSSKHGFTYTTFLRQDRNNKHTSILMY
jgi:hypothetical protein